MSIATKLDRREVASIYSAASSAVWYSHYLANDRARGASREEDYVATLVTDAIPWLAARWTPLLMSKGLRLRISGVFCHGHPQVRFGKPTRTVELADLLIVREHIGKTQNTSRAMLVQAKMSTDGTHHLAAADPQLELFANWPPFEFVTGGLSKGQRLLRERGKGSRYALIFNEEAYPEYITWPDLCPWASCAATKDLSAEQSFAKLIGDMLLNKDGRIARLGKPRDDWSRTIKELLEVTGKRTYKRANIGRGNTPRLATAVTPAVLFFADLGNFSSSTTPRIRMGIADRIFGNTPLEQNSGEDEVRSPPPAQLAMPDGGISTLIIETRDLDP